MTIYNPYCNHILDYYGNYWCEKHKHWRHFTTLDTRPIVNWLEILGIQCVTKCKERFSVIKISYESVQLLRVHQICTPIFSSLNVPLLVNNCIKHPLENAALSLRKDLPHLNRYFKELINKLHDRETVVKKASEKIISEIKHAAAIRAVNDKIIEDELQRKEPNISRINDYLQKGASLDLNLLHLAARKGQVEALRLLIKWGAEVDKVSDKGLTPLNEAVIHEKIESVKILLSEKANPFLSSGFFLSPFFTAAKLGKEEILQAFIDANVAINYCDQRKNTALHIAAREGNLSSLKLLIKNGAEVNAVDTIDRTLLHLAINSKNLNVIDYLMREFSQLLLFKDYYGYTVLHSAVTFGYFETVQHMLRYQINLDIKTKSGWSAMHLAAQNNDINVIHALHKAGADINAKDDYLATPLHFAAKEGSLEAVSHLIFLKADVNLKTSTGKTPLHEAAKGKSVAIICRLIEAGGDVNVQSRTQMTPLMTAIECSTFDVFETLMRYDPRLDLVNSNGNSVLHLALINGDKKIAEALLSKGVSVHKVNFFQQTPLHVASLYNRYDLIPLLAKAGVNLEEKTERGNSALWIAASKGNTKTLKVLLSLGAIWQNDTQKGETILHLAVQRGSLLAIESLIDAGISVHETDRGGNTPLHYAVALLKLDAMMLLLKKGAHRTLPNALEITPKSFYFSLGKNSQLLLEALKQKHFLALTEILETIDYIVYKDPKDGKHPFDQENILSYAIKKRNLRCLRALLKAGANPNASVSNVLPPLHMAVFKRDLEIVDLLLEVGADVNLADISGRTPCQIAYQYRYDFIFEKLFSFGAIHPNSELYLDKFPNIQKLYPENINIRLRSLMSDYRLVDHYSEDEWEAMFSLYTNNPSLFDGVSEGCARQNIVVGTTLCQVPLNLVCMESRKIRKMAFYNREKKDLFLPVKYPECVYSVIDHLMTNRCTLEPEYALQLYAIAQEHDLRLLKYNALMFIGKNGFYFTPENISLMFDLLSLYPEEHFNTMACKIIEEQNVPLSESIVSFIFTTHDASITLQQKAIDFIAKDCEITIDNFRFFLSASKRLKFPSCLLETLDAFIEEHREEVIEKFKKMGMVFVRLKYDLKGCLDRWALENSNETFIVSKDIDEELTRDINRKLSY